MFLPLNQKDINIFTLILKGGVPMILLIWLGIVHYMLHMEQKKSESQAALARIEYKELQARIFDVENRTFELQRSVIDEYKNNLERYTNTLSEFNLLTKNRLYGPSLPGNGIDTD